MSNVTFRILGPLEVEREGRTVALGGARQRALLALLLVHANEHISADRLIDELWGEPTPPRAVKRVQVAIARLRKALDGHDAGANGEVPLRTVTGGYVLAVGPGELDADVFAARVQDGRRVLEDGEPARAAEILREGLALWRGPPLAEVAYEPFAQPEIRRLEELRLNALELAIDGELGAGRHSKVVGEIEALVAEHPLRERLHAARMIALYRCGRQADALQAYRDAHRVLVTQAGVEPGPELRGVQEAILRQDVSLEPSPAARELPRELDVATAPPLVARDEELAWLRERWERARTGAGGLVAVIGRDGIGKSRLAAELAAEVARRGATVLYATGSGQAEAALAALRRARQAPGPALLVVDDADRAGADVLAALAELRRGLATVPVLLLVTGKDAGALACLGADGELALEPLDASAVRAIAVGYSPGHPAEGVPAEWLLDASEGVPRRVHELAGQWARREAARRVGAGAGRAAAGRAELRAIEAELAGDVVELQAARERVAPDGGDDDTPLVCPFKGLAAFEAADAPYFFGRERLVAELVARLVGAPLLGVVGPSGSGKSSALRAGLLPALAGGVLPGSADRRQVLIRPGGHPLRELRQACAYIPTDRSIVLAVDQFEETFTACHDEEERSVFIAELVRATHGRAGRHIVVLALRADYYGRCAAYPDLSRLLAANHVLVGAMQRDELRRAVECPAQRAGLRVDGELADALVADVEGEPGALPLLSTALLALWQRRDGRRLRHAAYEHTGGVRGAVARLGEEAFSRLDPAQRTIARSVLLRLAEEGSERAIERRRVPVAEFETEHSEDVARVVALLADRRLLTVSAGTIEIAHEALLREWPRLRGWFDEDAEGRRLHRHLTDAAREWDERGRNPGDLYRGARLASAFEWRAEHEQELNRSERAFLDAGRAVEQSELEAAKRRTRRLRALALGLAALVLVAGISAALAVRETKRAESERRTAVSRSLATQALSQLDRDLDVAALMSLEAYRMEPTIEARSAVLTVLPHLEHAAGALVGPTGRVSSAAFSADGETLASTHEDGTVRLWDTRARRPLGQPLRGHAGPVFKVAFSADGETLASAGTDGTVRLWDTRARRPLGQPLRGPAGPVGGVAFGADGETLASTHAGGTVWLWDTRRRRPLGQPLRGHAGGVIDVAFSVDGETLASAGVDGTVRLWDARARRPLGQPLRGHAGGVIDVAFGADGETLASAGEDGTVRLWDTRARRPLGQPLRGHTGLVAGVAFGADGETLASAGDDGTVRLWDTRARRPLGQPLRGPAGPVGGVAFGADGETLASTHEDGTVRLWDTRARRPLGQPLRGPAGPVGGVAFGADGETLASTHADGTVRLWDARARRPLGQPLRGHTGLVGGVAFGADGETLASAGSDGTVRLWDTRARRQLGQPLRGPAGPVGGVAFSADGETLASTHEDGTVRLWDARARRPLGQPLPGHAGPVGGVAFGADGETLASTHADGAVWLWDARARRPSPQPLRGHIGLVLAVAFTADRETLASAGSDGTVRLWDTRARRQLGQPLRGPAGPVGGVAFSADGETLASTHADGTVRLWDTRARRPLGQPLRGHAGPVGGVAFGADGETLASAGDDGTVRLWDPILWSDSSRAFRDRACPAVRRSLSHAEWQEFLRGEPYHETC